MNLIFHHYNTIKPLSLKMTSSEINFSYTCFFCLPFSWETLCVFFSLLYISHFLCSSHISELLEKISFIMPKIHPLEFSFSKGLLITHFSVFIAWNLSETISLFHLLSLKIFLLSIEFCIERHHFIMSGLPCYWEYCCQSNCHSLKHNLTFWICF